MSGGCNFHRARLKQDLSIADVARAMEVTKAAVSKWDRGLSYPRPDMALKLAKLLKIDADDLQRDPVSHHAPKAPADAETVTDIFADARRRLGRILGLPTNRIKFTMTIDG